MQTGKKGLALLLALLMVFSLLPVSALAADGCLTATGADKTFTAKQGENLTVQLAQYFTDSEGHTLTYTLDAYGDEIFSGTVTKIDMDNETVTVSVSAFFGKETSVELELDQVELEK